MSEFLEQIRSKFEGINIEYVTATEEANYPVFIIHLDGEATLVTNWKAITSVIAARFHASLSNEQDFERWNTYIIFACRGAVDKALRGIIENDKFAARKIVVPKVPENMQNAELVEKYVTNKDILVGDVSEHADDRIPMSAKKKPTEDLLREGIPDSFVSASQNTNGIRSLVGEDFVESRLGAKQQAKLESLLKKIEESFE